MYDLIIIGGGMSGIAVGHFFRHKKILILERGDLLAGATGNNAGFIISGFGEHFSNTARRLGIDTAKQIQKIHLASHRQIKTLARSIDCDYSASGSYAVALNAKEWSELQESHALMRSVGYRVELLQDPPVGLKDNFGALFNPDDACFDSAKFWGGVASGLPVRPNCEVKAVHQKSDRIVVKCASESFETRRVVYCLNAFSSALLRELQGKYIPLRGQMFDVPLTGQAPSQAPVFGQHGDVFWHFTETHLQFGGLENLVPADEVGIVESSSTALLSEQVRWMEEHLQIHQPTKPERIRFSTLAYTLDGFPFVGQLPGENEYVLAGLCGMGNSYALEAARWLYKLIENGQNFIPSYCRSDRINELPTFQGGNWRKIYEAWNH